MKILNFGSLNLDFVYSVEHLVCPGETLASSGLAINCGGKGLNQSIALSRAGLEVYHAGSIGEDGKPLLDLLLENHVDTRYVRLSRERTGNAVIQVDSSGQNSILLYGGANHDIGRDTADSVLSHFDSGDYILLQNEISSLDYIMERAWHKGMKIILNPSPANASLNLLPLQYVSIFLLNEIEGEFLTGQKESEDMAANLLSRYPDSAVVLTLGEKGALYQDASQACRHAAYPVPVKDTTAAGDTFTGFFLASFLQGTCAHEALKLASMASSIAVSRPGAANSIPLSGEVRARLAQSGQPGAPA